MIKTIIINQVSEIKKGTSATRDGKSFNWTLYKVIDAEGTEYTSFDKFEPNTEVQVDFEIKKTEKNGKFYENKSIKIVRCLHCFHCPK